MLHSLFHSLIETRLDAWEVRHLSAVLITPVGTFHYGDQDHVYDLASVTKLITAYTALIACEEEAITLDEPAGPATVRHLLAHTSGVGFATREVQCAPGERRIYSSAGYEILAEHLAHNTEIPFPYYVREGLCVPLGLESTTIYGSPGHGGKATARDLERFVRELLSPKLIAPETLTQAMTVQYPDTIGIVPGYGMYKPCDWGLGFEIKGAKQNHWFGDEARPDTCGHFGQAGTYVWVNRRRHCAMVVLTDRPFGDWAKPLWAETNSAIWHQLNALPHLDQYN